MEQPAIMDVGAISTHSLTRRLTLYALIGSLLIDISTHSHTRRLTKQQEGLIFQILYFNSQPHKEADSLVFDFIGLPAIFQLTASQGG